ncbi:MAG: TetR/AcrR family transcriptional regulator [Rubellimicrobium sp.]|nr:TetR/AcrR family transcriptional regulator [Rubellimicrobium sp.]
MRKPADIRKAEIVACALVLADRIGPDRVTTAAVAQAVGVTQAALFRHFPTKSAMWLAVAGQVADDLTGAWAAALGEAGTPPERLRALVQAQFTQIVATPAMPMLLHSRELNVGNHDLRGAFRDRLRAFHGHLVQEFAAGQRARLFDAQVAPPDAAALLSSLVQGVAIRWALGARDFDLMAEGLRLFDVQMRLFAAKGA